MEAVRRRRIPVRLACAAFGISEACYRYRPKLATENEEIADHLLRLTHNQRNWGFGSCANAFRIRPWLPFLYY